MANPFEKIKELDEFRVEDFQQNVEARSEYICYELGSFYNPLHFVDRDAFPTRLTKEAENMAKLQSMLDDGDFFVHTLYTYRSIAKALPPVKQELPNKPDIYRKQFDVLTPELKKVRDLMSYYSEVIDRVSGIIVELVANEKRKEIPSDTLLDYLIKVMDFILKLDALKNMKAALSNDFSTLRRAIQFMSRDGIDQQYASMVDIQSDESIRLYDFLSKKGAIMKGFKESVQKIAGFEDIICLIIDRCTENFVQQRYLFSDEKHSFIRVGALGLFLIDNEKGINYKKLDSLSALCKIFRKHPCVPLYGDMTFMVKTILKTCPNLPESDWMVKDEAKTEQHYLLKNHIPSIRKEFASFVGRFSSVINKIKNVSKVNGEQATDDIRKNVKLLTEDGMKLISTWSCRILEQSSWKFTHPASPETIAAFMALNPDSNETEKKPENGDKKPEEGGEAKSEEGRKKKPGEEYERVVRFNFNAEERAALVDTISMIKSLEAMMLKHTAIVAPLIKAQIYSELQEFVSTVVQAMLDRTKQKKRAIHSTVNELRNIAADWLDKPAVTMAKSKSVKKDTPDIPKRKIGPSFTQLHMIRSLLTVLYSDRSPGMIKKGLFGDKDFNDEQVKQMKAFYDSSSSWNYLLNYNNSLRRAADLSSLWYREFYLEITQCVQFPIEMSLPWILVEDIIEKRNTTFMESIIYPLSLYNDAASHALFTLRRGFLYDEVEAEVNLVFDQLMYKLSEQIYSYYKSQAVNIVLDTRFRSALEKIQKVSRFTAPKNRYESILNLKHINLLGRYIDLNHLLGQRLNNSLRENLHKVIQRFESSPLTSIIETENLIECVRVTHQLLNPLVSLDPYETMLADANESLSASNFEGRISRHIIEELLMDIFPTYNFNTVTQRFVMAPNLVDPRTNKPVAYVSYERDKMRGCPPYYLFCSKLFTNAFSHVHDQYRYYFGVDHMRAIVRLIGKSSLAILVESIIAFIEQKMDSELSPYVGALIDVIPPQVKLQPAAYGLFGVFSYFKMQFRDFTDYAMLKHGVYQAFRHCGNAICFLSVLDNVAVVADFAETVAAAPFIAMRPLSRKEKDTRIKEKEKMEEIADGVTPNLDPYFRLDDPEKAPIVSRINYFVNIPEVVPFLSSPDLARELPRVAYRAARLYTPSRQGVSLFKSSLERLSKIMDHFKQEWKGTSPVDRIQKLDSSKEFYRLWAILQFVFCITEKERQTDFDFFGDGFHWAGCTFLYLFGQQLRFDAFNFCDHVLNINVISSKGREQITHFLNLATEVRMLNNRIFNTLKTYLPIQYNSIDSFSVPNSDDFGAIKIVATIAAEPPKSNDNAPQKPPVVAPPSMNTPPPPMNTPPPPPPMSTPPPPKPMSTPPPMGAPPPPPPMTTPPPPPMTTTPPPPMGGPPKPPMGTPPPPMSTPPKPPMNAPAPPPPMGAPPKPTSAPPPPMGGPPPPPPMGSGGPPPPPPPPPPAPVASKSSGGNDDGGGNDLMAQLQRKKNKLNKVQAPDDSPKLEMKKPADAQGSPTHTPAAPPSSSGGDMMSAILAARAKMQKKN